MKGEKTNFGVEALVLNAPSIISLSFVVLAVATVPNGFISDNDSIGAIYEFFSQFPPFFFVRNKIVESNIVDAIIVANFLMWTAAPFMWMTVVVRANRLGLETIFPNAGASRIRAGSTAWRLIVFLALAANTYVLTLSDGDLKGCRGCMTDSRVTSGFLTWLFFWTQGFLMGILFAGSKRN
jgi:hypothetical protein